MATQFEHHDTYADYIDGMTGAGWKCQTFTPATSHRITSVKFRLGKNGVASYAINVVIKAVDGAGKPTGDALASGSIGSLDITAEYPANASYEITLGAGADLTATTQYAIVVSAPDAAVTDDIYFFGDSSSPSYTGGQRGYSVDSGANWTMTSAVDYCFEDWGIIIYSTDITVGSLTITGQTATFGKIYTLVCSVANMIITGLTATFSMKWTRKTKNTATWADETKNSSSWTDKSKSSSSWNNKNKV